EVLRVALEDGVGTDQAATAGLVLNGHLDTLELVLEVGLEQADEGVEAPARVVGDDDRDGLALEGDARVLLGGGRVPTGWLLGLLAQAAAPTGAARGEREARRGSGHAGKDP